MRSYSGNAGLAARFCAGCVYLSLFTLMMSMATAQNPTLKTRSKADREELYAAMHRITMNVQVTDSAGNPISDLNAANFAIYDNNQSRKIAAFHAIDGAAMNDASEIVILLDAVNSSAQALVVEKNAIFKYLAQSRKPFSHPTSFALWFNGHLSVTQPTTDRNSVGRAFVKMTKGLHSNACTEEPSPTEQTAAPQKIAISKANARVDPATCRAVHFKDSVSALDGIAQQQMTVGGRTLLIWVGQGWPTLSDTELHHLTSKEQRDYAQESVNVLHDLRAAQLTLYSIAPADATNQTGPGAESPAIVRVSDSPSSAVIRGLVLPELTQRTGGRLMAASHNMTADIVACVRDADWYYSVSFNAPPAQNGAGELHSLQIQVNRPGLQVRAMSEYFTEP